METSFSWLHLSDLHQGMYDQDWLWPGMKELFFKDLERLHDKCGPWDLVLFSGDLTQCGSVEEFRKVDKLLQQLQEFLAKQSPSSMPLLLAVPGNHDLVRPDQKDLRVRLLRRWHDDSEVRDEFWGNADSPYRQIVNQAFENYTIWWQQHAGKLKNYRSGLLPGDFSVTIKKGDAKLGIIGLNTSFLQFTEHDYANKLSLHTRQFHEACDGNGVKWAKQHHACLLLTHHPANWLSPDAQQCLKGEIIAHGRFAAHLCGHMHDVVAYHNIADAGTEVRRTWQSRSLFGLEYLDNKEQRSHGYTVGRIELDGEQGILTFWPRKAHLQANQRKIVPDYDLDLTNDQHTKLVRCQLLNPFPKVQKAGLAIMLDMSLEELRSPLLKQIITNLQQLGRIISLNVRVIEAGSVRLVLEGIRQDIDRLIALYRSGKFNTLQSIPVLYIQEIDLGQYARIPAGTSIEELLERAKRTVAPPHKLSQPKRKATENKKYQPQALPGGKQLGELAQYWDLLSQKRTALELQNTLEAQEIRLAQLIAKTNIERKQIERKLSDLEARLPPDLKEFTKTMASQNGGQISHLREQALNIWGMQFPETSEISNQDEDKIRLSRLQAEELARLVKEDEFVKIAELQGQWLPELKKAPAPLVTLTEVARYLQAAKQGTIAYHRLQHLDRAEKSLNALKNKLFSDSSPLAFALRETLPAWENVIIKLRTKLKELARQTLPNPFFAGDPLDPEYGREVFRGRMEVVRKIEFLLADPQQGGSIALLGPRRSGKTSLLKMLPALLPDAVCVFFDLQDNPVSSPATFFQAMAKRARDQAARDRQVELPPLPEGPPFEAASQWLQDLETAETLQSAAGRRRVLVCIDEFERLETLFPGERRELLQLMGLFRATIQHRRHVRLLISGAAPFDELDRIWSDHFINVREFQLEHLPKNIAIDLLIKPIADFPSETVPVEVAERIFSRTGGQPFLLQLYGSLLISHLNEGRRKRAETEDVEVVEEKALEEAAYYFRDTVKAAPEKAQQALAALAEAGKTLQIDKQTRRWLKRRYLLTDDGKLLIPVLGEWIREYW
ncbi:MAG: AAA family ATPase [Gammaproteobacteria bacterium]|nr:AAA family ATPase [Gammaproteobacteria bacterium]